MTNDKQLTVEPISFGMRGFKVDDLLLKDFVAELRKELPTSMIVHFCIGFTDSKDIIAISHSRLDGTYMLDRVDAEGTNAEQVARVVKVLKKVIT